MNIGTINLATSRLSKTASSFPSDTLGFTLDDSRLVADLEVQFKLLTLTVRHEDLLNLKTDRFIEMQIDKLKSRLAAMSIQLDPGTDPFAAMVKSKAMTAAEMIEAHGTNSRCVEVSQVAEMVMTIAPYEFFKKIRRTNPELFTPAEAAMSEYARKHRLALRLTSNAFLSDDEKDKRNKKEKREANFELMRKFTSDPDKIDY